jgi:acyl-CoA reductase-like NAD-dependent aldehyde dehydrogenase
MPINQTMLSINGVLVPPDNGATFDVHNPATGEVFAQW